MNSGGEKISIIIVNLNTGNILRECIESFFKYEKDFDSEIIIVDQNSGDNSREVIIELAGRFDNIKYIFNDTLKSFSYANNQGFDISTGDHVLIMNPDIVFINPVLKKLVSGMKNNPEIGAMSPYLMGKDGKFQQEYFRRYPSVMQFILFYMIFSKPFYRSSKLRCRYFENSDINTNSGTVEFVEQIPCAFFLTKRKIFESVGKMDDKYILFYEDVDLSFRIHRNYKLGVDMSVKVLHLGGQSFKTENNWWLHGRFLMSMHYFMEKNRGKFKSFLLKTFSLSNSVFIVAFERIKLLMGKKDTYRYNKHKYYLQEFKKAYLQF
ncbi:MAG: glycosyltransferase family 2 protein [Ignavibacteriae bacterium]|nr:glycosyltransferase family 2 protein [Ignavibacteriota bacterium]